jgi:hypothetical protein
VTVEAATSEVAVVAHCLDRPLHDRAPVVERAFLTRAERRHELVLERHRRE